MPTTETNIVALREKMKNELASVHESIAPPSGFSISTKGKVFTFPDGSSTTDAIDAVILDWRTVNQYYTGAYNPTAPQPPVCFAINKTIKDLAPHPSSPDAQNDICKGCPKDEWGSAPGGSKGKACKNTARLALVMPGANLETPVWILNVSPTGLRSFNAHVNKLADTFGMLPIQVVTKISFNANEAYPQLIFGDATAHEEVDTMLQLREGAQSMLDKAPDAQ